MNANTVVTIYWSGAALVAVCCIIGTVRLVRETGDPGLAGAGILLVLLWPLLIPLVLFAGGCERFAGWVRVKRDRPWPQPLIGKVRPEDQW